jgi:hypothetical protein
MNKQCNTAALDTIYRAIDDKVFEQIKDFKKANKLWIRLEETYEGTSTVKSAKLYMLKDKFSTFKMKDDESIPEMFYRLQVIINDLKGLGEKVEDMDFSHKFLMCLPKKFATLRRMIFREGLNKVKSTNVLGDIMTDAQYNDDEDEVEESSKRSPLHSRLHPLRARARWRVMMMIHSMIRPWPSLCTRWEDS